MAWEIRGKRKYYYAKRRVNGWVVSVSGVGSAAQDASDEVEHRRERREAVKRRLYEIEQQKAQLDLLCERANQAVELSLEADGYRYHRGQYRRRKVDLKGMHPLQVLAVISSRISRLQAECGSRIGWGGLGSNRPDSDFGWSGVAFRRNLRFKI